MATATETVVPDYRESRPGGKHRLSDAARREEIPEQDRAPGNRRLPNRAFGHAARGDKRGKLIGL